MGRTFAHALSGPVLALTLAVATVVSGCGAGGSGGGAFATVVFENNPASIHTITHVSFDFFDLSLIGDRNVAVTVGPNQSASFTFNEFEADNLFNATLTWSDLQTSQVLMFPFVSGGGTVSFPVTR